MEVSQGRCSENPHTMPVYVPIGWSSRKLLNVTPDEVRSGLRVLMWISACRLAYNGCVSGLGGVAAVVAPGVDPCLLFRTFVARCFAPAYAVSVSLHFAPALVYHICTCIMWISGGRIWHE